MDAFRGHGLSLLGRFAPCGVSRLMLFPQESPPSAFSSGLISKMNPSELFAAVFMKRLLLQLQYFSKNKKPGRTVKTVSPRLLSLRVTAMAVCFLSDQASYAAEP
ncbi:hypothetical protein BBI11_13350 [Planococcus maritimus]|nr:hypothetical protein BBI11_13350 [Planococcus maritimus]